MASYNLTIYPAPDTMPRRILTGQRFTRLLVIGYAGKHPSMGQMWHCLCDCSNTITVSAINLLAKNGTQSCKCLSRERLKEGRETHKGTHDIEYQTYRDAKRRCKPMFPHYGDRGIEFRFVSYQEFLEHIGRKPSPQHSLDRIDVNGHYEKGNVRWANNATQSRNKRNNVWITAFGQTRVLQDWAKDIHIKHCTLWSRFKQYGWCAECTLTIPVKGGKCPHIGQPT